MPSSEPPYPAPTPFARFAAIAAILALLLGSFSVLQRPPVAAGAVNLLANPGFELDADADGRPDAWSTGNLLTRSSTSTHGGAFAGRFQSTANKGQTSYQQVGVVAGAAYDVGGWVSIPTTSDAFTFQLKVQWRSGSGQLGSVVLRKYTDDTAGAWQEVTASLTAPSGATGARVQLIAAKLNATIHVDDLFFGATGGTTPTPTPVPTPIWRYGAEPDAGTERTLVDATGVAGHLTADVEGLVIVPGPDGGYLVASSQGDDSYVIYDRDDYAHLGTFRIVDSPSIDGAEHTDGIDITTAPLGSAFPGGVFVAQDGSNPDANQNFKLVPWDDVLESVGLVTSSHSSIR